MRHRKTYMFIIFGKFSRASRSVITVHAILFAKNRKLHKFATTNSNLKKKDSCRHRLMSQQALPCTPPPPNDRGWVAIRISKNHVFWTCTTT